MAKFRNLDHLYSAIKKEVKKALTSNGFQDDLRVEMVSQIKEEVYKEYNPKLYNRKREYGGLLDRRNMVGELVDDTTLHFRNTRKDKGQRYEKYFGADEVKGNYVDETIVYGGRKYLYYYGDNINEYSYLKPRDFYKTTSEALDSKGIHINSLKRELKRSNIKVK